MKKLIMLILAITTLSFGITKDNLQNEMNKNVTSILEKIKTKDNNGVVALLDSVMDYKTMAKISLSQYWNSLSEDQQDRFSISFENKVKQSYIDKLNLYSNQKVVLKDYVQTKENRIEIDSDIISETETYLVKYKFFDNNNDWKIYDIDILGVSVLQTYRQQFKGYLQDQTKNIETLIVDLDKLK